MFKYAFKRVLRGYKLFLALTLGVLIATTFFASMLMSADVTSQAAASQALEEVAYDARISANNITWTNADYDAIKNISESLDEVSSVERYAKVNFNYNSTAGQSFDVYGLEQSSTVWNSLTFLNASETLAANETFVVASSVNASLLSIGDTVTVPVRYFTNDSFLPKSFEVNLTVAGFVEISESTARLLNPPTTINLGFIEIELGDWREYDLMIVDWDTTMEPILDYYSQQENATQLIANQGFLVHLNRDLVINPYDLGASSTNVQNALAKIEDRTAIYNTRTNNLVGTTLTFLSLSASLLVLSFVALAAPVIFMSWYSSTMLSDVSYNLRRREFGLLQTKGFGPKAIKRMLTLEGVIIGIIGGTIGLFIGTYLAHFIVGVPIESPFVTLASNPLNVVVTIAFGAILAYWSIRGPADRAARLDVLDSLKQYIYIEEQREYKRLLPIIAFVLGTYKLVVWILGIDMNALLGTALSTNFILLIVIALWTPVDQFLNFAGPIAFLYGATKILLRGSQKFQETIVGAGKRFFGASGNLATRNVKRNPSRNAALVFVVALIVSYGIFSVGSLFSEQDLRERTNLYNVGSDVSAVFAAGENMTDILPDLQEIEGVESLTTEYQISLSTTRGQLQTRAIDPDAWLDSAFYEESWFSGDTFDNLFSNFTGQKIILSVSVARQLELRVGNTVTVRMPTGTTYLMEIIGFTGFRGPLDDLLGQFSFGGSYPSYIPIDFLESSGFLVYAAPHVLMKTTPGTNGTLVEEEITALAPEVRSTDSSTTRGTDWEEATFQQGGTRARWLGIAFAVVLAIAGTGLIVTLTLREKEYETTLLAVRGFTKQQVMKVLVAEVMVMILFSLLLGAGTGIIQLFGDIANTSQNTQALVRPQLVLTPIVIGLMSLIVVVIVLSALIPILLTTRFDESKIDVLRE